MVAYFFLPTLVFIICIMTAVEYWLNRQIKIQPARPNSNSKEDGFSKIMTSNIHELIFKLESGYMLNDDDNETIEQTCLYLDARYDCSDFRMQTLIRLIYRYSDKLTAASKEKIKKSLLGSKFFMDQRGSDSLCLWSENHLLIFAAAEYLIGQLYEDEIFTNDGRTGLYHKEAAAKRIEIWLSQRYEYGFIEWYSNTYYEEDIAPLANLIEFCDNKLLVTRTKVIMDLLLYDMATQSYKGSFTSTSGRQYEFGKKSGDRSALKSITNQIWGFEGVKAEKGLDQNFLYMKNYEVPEVIKKIGRNHDVQIIRATQGLDLGELVHLFPDEKTLPRVMMQWAMEAFSNPEVINSTTKYIHKNRMLSNEFLAGFQMIDLSILKVTGLLPAVSRFLRPISNGTAIQRANTYTYKTESYMLATAQSYHPGEFGDQHHIWSATLDHDVCVFTTHPACPLSEEGALSASPNYWVGNGRNPHSVQDQSVNMTIYYIDGKKGFMEKELLYKSHCYFPVQLFDEVIIQDKAIYGRKADAFISVRGIHHFVQSGDEFIQEGALTCWVTELGSSMKESFNEFVLRVGHNEMTCDEDSMIVEYETQERKHSLTYKGNYLIDGQLVNMVHMRFDSPYATVNRNSKTMTFELDSSRLFLDFENGMREVTSSERDGEIHADK